MTQKILFTTMLQNIHIHKAATFSGHKDCIYALEKETNETFFSAGSDGFVVRWSISKPDEGELIAQVASSVYALHYLPFENQLLVGQNHEGIYKIDLSNNAIIQSAKITTSQIFDIKSSNKYILIATGDGLLVSLSRQDLSVVSKIKLSEKSIRCIAINPLHGTYAVGCSDFSIQIFSFSGNQLLHRLEAHSNSVFSLAYSPDGKYLISGSRDAALKIWETENYQLHQSIPAHLFAVNNILFSENGQYFATASMDKTIKLWNADSFRLLKVIDKARHASHTTSVNKLLWLGNELVSASDDKKIFLWQIEGLV